MTVNVLFVCLGNICRSPTAHGVFQHRVDARGLGEQVRVDSAGTGGWHIGNPPDRRAAAAARQRGYDLSALRARQVAAEDFARFDYLLAMDADNLQHLDALQPADFDGELGLFLGYGSGSGVLEVPDPYFGGDGGFEHVLDLIEGASDGLLDHILQRHRL